MLLKEGFCVVVAFYMYSINKTADVNLLNKISKRDLSSEHRVSYAEKSVNSFRHGHSVPRHRCKRAWWARFKEKWTQRRMLHLYRLTNIIQTYWAKIRQFKMGTIHLEYVASGFPKHIHTEAHSLLKKKKMWKVAVRGNFVLLSISCVLFQFWTDFEKHTCCCPGGQAFGSFKPLFYRRLFLRSLSKSTKQCLSKYGKWDVGADTTADFFENRGDGKHTAHLDDTDLVRLDHHLPKLCGDQDLSLLRDCAHKQTKRDTEKRKFEQEGRLMFELSLFLW